MTVLLATATGVPCLTAQVASAAPAVHRHAGAVLAWGSDSNGQVGHGSTITGGPVPVVEVFLPAGTRVTAVAGGSVHSLALTSDGRVLAWGSNFLGQLGVGSDMGDNSTSTPVVVHLPAGTDATAITAGIEHSLALTSLGTVLGWGDNAAGDLGDGTTTKRTSPVPVDLPPGTKVTAVAAGGTQSLALTSDGRVLAWGGNRDGELGDGTTTDRHTPVPVDLPPGIRVTSIAAGALQSLALTSDGRLLAWGQNIGDVFGKGGPAFSSTPVFVSLPPGVLVTAISAGFASSAARLSDGDILIYRTSGGESPLLITPDLPAGTRVTAIAGGGEQTLLVTSDGRVLRINSQPAGPPACFRILAAAVALAAGDGTSLVVAVPRHRSHP